MKKYKLLWQFLLIIVCLAGTMPVYASDISDAGYVADIVVTNAGDTTASNVSTVFDLSTDNLVDGNYIADDFANTALRSSTGTDIAYMPVPEMDVWSLFVSSISAFASQNGLLYTGGSTDMEGKLRYMPGDGGMSTLDDASLELGDDFRIEQKGWVTAEYSPGTGFTPAQIASGGATGLNTIIYDSSWGAQTYTPNGYQYVTSVEFYGLRDGAPNELCLMICDVDGSGLPDTGSVLATGSTEAGSGTTYYEIELDTPLCLNDGQQYSLVYYTVNGDGSHGYLIQYNSSGYSGGNRCLSTDGGASWSEMAGTDLTFRINGGAAYNYLTFKDSAIEAAVAGDDGIISVDINNNTVLTATGITSAEQEVTISCENEVDYPDFEEGASDQWSSDWAPGSRSTDQAYTGSYSYKIESNGTWCAKRYHIDEYVLYRGDTITLTGYYYCPATNDRTQKIRIEDGVGQSETATLTKDGAWHYFTLSRTMDAASNKLHILFWSNLTGTTDSDDLLYVDDLELRIIHIDIDGTAKDVSGGVTVNDNANNWTFLEDGSMPYMEYQKIYVGGAMVQHIEYEYDTTFDDLSGNDNDATPTFRTATSNADVTAAFTNYRPVDEAILSGYIPDDDVSMVSGAPDMPSETYTEGNVNHLPGAAVINSLLDTGGIPQSLFWFPVLFGITCLMALVTYNFTKSLMMMCIVGGVFIAFFGVMGAIPLWLLIPYGIACYSIVIKRETASL